MRAGGKLGFRIALLLLILPSAHLSARGCFYYANLAIYKLFPNPEAEQFKKTMLDFLKDPVGKACPLTLAQIQKFIYFDQGGESKVFQVPDSTWLVKIPLLTDEVTTDYKTNKAQRLDKLSELLPGVFHRTIFVVSADGSPIEIQQEIPILSRWTSLAKMDAVMNQIMVRIHKTNPEAVLSPTHNIHLKLNGQTVILADIKPSNIGFVNGEPVLTDLIILGNPDGSGPPPPVIDLFNPSAN